MNSKVKLLIGVLALVVILTTLFASTVFAAPPWGTDTTSPTYCGQQYCRGANGESCQANCQGTCDGDCDGTCQGNCQPGTNCQGIGGCGSGQQGQGQRCYEGNGNQGCGGPCAGRTY